MAAVPYPLTQLNVNDLAPYMDGAAVTPSDSTDLTYITRGIYVGGTGAVALITQAGTTLTFAAVPAGTIIPVKAARIKSTGTTATSIVALY